MSGRIQGLSIGMGMDSADISRSMSQIKRDMRGLNSEAKVTSNNFKYGKRDTDSYKKAIDQLSGTTDKQRQNVEELGKRYAQTVEEQGASSRAAQDLAIEYNKQADNLNRLENELGNMEKELAKLNEEQRIAESRWNKTGEALERNGARFEKVGGGMQKVGGIFTAMSAAIVGGALGAGAGLFALTNKATEAADGIAKGAERMGTSTDFYQEMDFWASQNGLSQEQMEKAVGRLNQRLGLAVEGNEKYANALERLGVDLQGVEDGTITTEDAMATSIQTLSEMENESEKAALASELFGTKMARDLMPALNDGSLSIEEAKEKAEELGLVMSEDQIKAAEEFQDAQDQIKRAMGAVAMQIGLDLMPHFQRMLDWILDNMPSIRETISGAFDTVVEKVQSVVEWWNKTTDTMRMIIPIVAGVALAFGPVLLVAGKMISTLGNIMVAIGPVLKGIAQAGGLLRWLAPLFGMLTAPVTLTIAAIAALGAGFVLAYRKSETFRNFIDGLKDRFMDAWESVLNFKDNFMTAFDAIFALFKGDDGGIDLLKSLGLNDSQISMITGAVDRIKETFETMKENIMNALDGVAGFFIEQFNGIKTWWDSDGEMILSAIGTFFENMMNGIRRVADIGLSFVISLFETFAPIVKGIWDTLWPTILFLVENVWEKIQLAIGIAMDLIQGIISGVAAIIEGDWSRFGQILADTTASIRDRVTEFFGNLRDNALELFNRLTGGAIDKFVELRDGVIERVQRLVHRALWEWERLKMQTEHHIRLMVAKVKEFFRDLWKNITDRVKNIRDSVVNRFTELKDDAINRVTQLFNSVTDFFSDLWSNTTQKARDIKNDVTGFFGDMKNNTVDAAREMWTGVTDFFSDIWDDATSLFDDLVDGAKKLPGRIGDAIKNMASHAVDGAKSMGNKIASNLETVVNRIVGGLNSILNAIGLDDPIDEISIKRFSTGTGGGQSGRVGAAGNFQAFSTGTMNGRIAEDMLGILNDRGPGNGPGGAVQEVIERNGNLLAPKGKDALVPLKQGDRIYNGAETWMMKMTGMIPRFSTGTGVGSGTDGRGKKEEKKGFFSSLKDITSNVWDFIKEPGKVIQSIVDDISPDFSNFSGFAGHLLSGGFNFVKDTALDWLTGIFKDNESGEVDGGSVLNRGITAGFGFYPPHIAKQLGVTRHYGVDTAHRYERLTSPVTGKVTRVWNDRLGGNSIQIKSGELNWWFMHMQSIARQVGDMVKAGATNLGITGNTGLRTTGYHLHTQAMRGGIGNAFAIDPMPLLRQAESHLLGGRTLTDGLFNLHGGEYIINPNKPTEAQKLLAIVGKKLAGKSKQTRELPNPGRSGSDKSDQILDALNTLIDLISDKEDKVVLNVDGHTLAEVLNPHSEKIGGKNIKNVGRGLA